MSQEVLGKTLDIIIPMELLEAHWAVSTAQFRGAHEIFCQTMITESFDETWKDDSRRFHFRSVENATGVVTGALALVRDAAERYTQRVH